MRRHSDCAKRFWDCVRRNPVESSTPDYVKLAVPVAPSGRVPWYKNTFPTYAGIFLWVGFYLDLAGTDDRLRERRALPLGAAPGGSPLFRSLLLRSCNARDANGALSLRCGYLDIRNDGRILDARPFDGGTSSRLGRCYRLRRLHVHHERAESKFERPIFCHCRAVGLQSWLGCRERHSLRWESSEVHQLGAASNGSHRFFGK